jgi:hypothetical protein
MIRAALVICIVAMPAHGQQGPRMQMTAGDAACFAIVRIENRHGWYNEVETLPTEFGPVAIRYRTVGSHTAGSAANADKVAVEILPPGVLAMPMQMDILDGDTGTICLREYIGG